MRNSQIYHPIHMGFQNLRTRPLRHCGPLPQCVPF
jgi:hypothetical protein